jgi:hypothetical protein
MMIGQDPLPYISFIDQEAILNKLTDNIAPSFENFGVEKEGC